MKRIDRVAFCEPFRFQVGDSVKTITNKLGRVTAIGGFYIEGKFSSPVFRVGKNSYWYEWQLQHAVAKRHRPVRVGTP